MVFDAVVFHTSQTIILKLLSSDVKNIRTNYNFYVDDRSPFFIKRVAEFAMEYAGIYLPGYNDYSAPYSRTKELSLSGPLQKAWLDNYKKAYKELNGVNPLIIDLTKDNEFPTEEIA